MRLLQQWRTRFPKRYQKVGVRPSSECYCGQSSCHSEWTAISPKETTIEIVARASNRIFVGFPLCELNANSINPYVMVNLRS